MTEEEEEEEEEREREEEGMEAEASLPCSTEGGGLNLDTERVQIERRTTMLVKPFDANERRRGKNPSLQMI